MGTSSPEVTCPVCGALTELVMVFKSRMKTKYFKSPTKESPSSAQLYWSLCLNGSLVGQLGRKFHTPLVPKGVGARICEPCMLFSTHLLDEYQLDFLDSFVGGQRQRRKQTGGKKKSISVTRTPAHVFSGWWPHCVYCFSFPLQTASASHICNFPTMSYFKFKHQCQPSKINLCKASISGKLLSISGKLFRKRKTICLFM